MSLSDPTLYILSGLPGSGKSTVSRLLAPRVQATHLRIDTIEQAMRELCGSEVQDEGYRLAYRVASDILRGGVSVIADSCNPVEATRRDWERVAIDASARYVNVEVVCSEAREHRRRVETRASTVAGLRLPTWAEVAGRRYDDWTVPRIVLETSGRTPEECVNKLLSNLSGGAVDVAFARKSRARGAQR